MCGCGWMGYWWMKLVGNMVCYIEWVYKIFDFIWIYFEDGLCIEKLMEIFFWYYGFDLISMFC